MHGDHEHITERQFFSGTAGNPRQRGDVFQGDGAVDFHRTIRAHIEWEAERLDLIEARGAEFQHMKFLAMRHDWL